MDIDPELRAHMEHVAALAALTARRLGLPDAHVGEVVRAAELHDIGKVAVPAGVLHRPAPLDAAAWALMRRHTVVGEHMLRRRPALASVARLVRASHERWDGGGYPDGLAGEAIPIGARIVAVCDAYDAMVSDRIYRPGMEPEAAHAELRRCAGTQFDPAVVEAFTAAVAPAEPAPAARVRVAGA